MPIADTAVFPDVQPWPTQAAPPPAGHNKPPVDEEARAAFRERLLSDRPDFEQKLDDIEAGAGRVRVTNDEEYGRAGEFIKIMRGAAGHINDAHKAAKEPYLEGGRAVDAAKNVLIARLDDAKAKVQPLMNEYAARKDAEERAERARIAAEQRAAADRAAAAERERQQAEADARRAAAEATNAEERAAAQARADEAARIADEAMEAASLAAAAPARAEPVRSDTGVSISGTTVWNSEVEDYAKAFKVVKTDPKVKEAIDKAIARLVRAGQREIPGIRIWPTKQAVAR